MGQDGAQQGGGGAAHQVLLAIRGVRVVGGGWIVSHSACHPHGPALPCHPLTHKRWLECALLQNGTIGFLQTLLHSLSLSLLQGLPQSLSHGLKHDLPSVEWLYHLLLSVTRLAMAHYMA